MDIEIWNLSVILVLVICFSRFIRVRIGNETISCAAAVVSLTA